MKKDTVEISRELRDEIFFFLGDVTDAFDTCMVDDTKECLHCRADRLGYRLHDETILLVKEISP